MTKLRHDPAITLDITVEGEGEIRTSSLEGLLRTHHLFHKSLRKLGKREPGTGLIRSMTLATTATFAQTSTLLYGSFGPSTRLAVNW